MNTISYEDFICLELRSGTIIKAENFSRAKKPSYKIWVDFGPETGVKQTSAQITHHYQPDELEERQVIGCLNLEPKNIAGFISEFLLTGFTDAQGKVYLATVNPPVPNGQKLF